MLFELDVFFFGFLNNLHRMMISQELERSGIFYIQRSNFDTKDEVWRRIEISIDDNFRMGHISKEQAELSRRQLKYKLDMRFERFEKLLNGEQKF